MKFCVLEGVVVLEESCLCFVSASALGESWSGEAGGHGQMPPPGMRAGPAPWSLEERLEGIMRKDSPHLPLLGTGSAVP